jgi:hypothetical protein
MKKLTLLSLVFVLMQTIGAMAQQIISVSQDPTMKADYSDIQTAIDAAKAGTTIYVYNGTYNGFRLNKKLTIIGPGYFLDENPQTHAQKNMYATIMGSKSITIDTLATGSTIQGLTIKTTVTIQQTNSITLKNCLFNGDSRLNIIHSSYIYIKSNFLTGIISNYLPTVSASDCQNISITNNYVLSNHVGYCISIGSSTNCNIINNVIYGNRMQCSNTNIKNNIISSIGDHSLTNCLLFNNLYSQIRDSTKFIKLNGNKYIADFSTLFLSPSGSTDGQWQLKEGSPAKGTGLNGVDCGMFGGAEPYNLSGISDIPVIYEFVAPKAAGTQDGLQVKLKVRTN